jgi:hypothetical protein
MPILLSQQKLFALCAPKNFPSIARQSHQHSSAPRKHRIATLDRFQPLRNDLSSRTLASSHSGIAQIPFTVVVVKICGKSSACGTVPATSRVPWSVVKSHPAGDQPRIIAGSATMVRPLLRSRLRFDALRSGIGRPVKLVFNAG